MGSSYILEVKQGKKWGDGRKIFRAEQRAREQEEKGGVTRKRSREVVFYRCDSLDLCLHILICKKLYIYFCLISKRNFFFFFC